MDSIARAVQTPPDTATRIPGVRPRLASFAAVGVRVDPAGPLTSSAQLIGQLRLAIQVGRIDAGVVLPSIRIGAIELGVHPNTVRKAYERLEESGIVHTRHGVGTIVQGAGSGSEHAHAAARIASDAVARAREAGVDTGTLAAAILAGAGSAPTGADAVRPGELLAGAPRGATIGLVTADEDLVATVTGEARERGQRLRVADPGDTFALADVAWSCSLVVLGPDASTPPVRRALAGARQVESLTS